MSGLTDRLAREPDYRPHCLNCATMRRMTLIEGGKVMWCAPVRDDTMDVGKTMLGAQYFPDRYGCDVKWDVETGEIVP